MKSGDPVSSTSERSEEDENRSKARWRGGVAMARRIGAKPREKEIGGNETIVALRK